MEAVGSSRQSCWANMPSELLRDVLMLIEESACSWPLRKNVVACAGVCRSWREIVKEITSNLKVSGKFTFPISVKQPGPRNYLIQCFVKRNCSTRTYHLYLNLSQASNDDGKFLLAARRCRRASYTEYVISLNAEDVSKGSSNYIGELRSNFLGTKFTVYDAQPPNVEAKVTKVRSTGIKQVSPRVPAGNYSVAHISYALNVLGSRGPRQIQCLMDAIPVSAIEAGGVSSARTAFLPGNFDSFPSLPSDRSKSTPSDSFRFGPFSRPKDEMLVLQNKAPRWHDQLHCWCLNFNGRVTVASVKNFRLVVSLENRAVGEEHQENVILQFGKVGKNIFIMDYQYPISAFQAFCICLSSFDTKIVCD